ncbi:hypothetical protein AAA315_18275 [Ruthenibacterium lactatiformans]|uniref:hypothetical protein n=2 Tax=Ruthenibacterium lactatiformans TaxID=1550024 RepID=UPI001403F265|nr:hypothetical protein [Ruthenibacterium lactatiformans]MBS5226917.1 hypothetical protein [Subdoligranulum sp.]MBN2997034.1 hypothetical protein [Ruthenibacterium lactatiformans]MBN3013178.1 hypothetical protein [Ruthenibacterium lactatiformans]MBN3017288.1 hypothetical protein [Ruthenibacterium lactatiformans]MBN3019687.1 hypothetical protein [Ruthenibacterium lactatiformans]
MDAMFCGSIHQDTVVAVPAVLPPALEAEPAAGAEELALPPQPASESAMTAHARNAEMIFFMFVPLFTPFFVIPNNSGFQRFQPNSNPSKLLSLVFNAMYFCFVFTIFRHRYFFVYHYFFQIYL